MKPAQIHRQLQRIERAQCGWPDDTMGTGYELLNNSGHLDRALRDPNPDHSYVQHCAEELIRSALVLLVRQRRTLNLMVTGHAARLALRHADSAAGQLDHAAQAIVRWRIERQPEQCAFWLAHLVGICLAVIHQCDRVNFVTYARAPWARRIEVDRLALRAGSGRSATGPTTQEGAL